MEPLPELLRHKNSSKVILSQKLTTHYKYSWRWQMIKPLKYIFLTITDFPKDQYTKISLYRTEKIHYYFEKLQSETVVAVFWGINLFH